MYPPEFYGSKVGEDPNRFLDEVYNVLAIMGVSSIQKPYLAADQLKGVSQLWYEQWEYNRPIEAGSIEWETFKSAFLDRLFLGN